MRHFVAYHNPERMGCSLQDGDPFSLVSNKPVQRLLQNVVWFVEGEGPGPKNYFLSSAFVVTSVGESDHADFKYRASGEGHSFQPRVPLNDLDWFADFFKSVGHFSLGVCEVAEARFIEILQGIAGSAGFVVG